MGSTNRDYDTITEHVPSLWTYQKIAARSAPKQTDLLLFLCHTGDIPLMSTFVARVTHDTAI